MPMFVLDTDPEQRHATANLRYGFHITGHGYAQAGTIRHNQDVASANVAQRMMSLTSVASFTAVPAKPMMRGSDLLVFARHAYHELHVGPTTALGNSDGKQRRRHADLGISKARQEKQLKML
ncbi:hypothetical protein CHU98_g4412 [Xylaria longipes]|nr:hypothetical protein CHU98_g4412 [Xylaria longipes]